MMKYINSIVQKLSVFKKKKQQTSWAQVLQQNQFFLGVKLHAGLIHSTVNYNKFNELIFTE